MKKADKKAMAAAARAALGLDEDAEAKTKAKSPKVQKVSAAPAVEEQPAPSTAMRTSRGSCDADITPAYVTPIHNRSKIYPDGAFAIGDSVWYRGERYYIERAPATWAESLHIRICDKPIVMDAHGRPAWERLTEKRNSFCVHPDQVTKAPAPTVKSMLVGRVPTKLAVERAEARKSGEKDVGDPIAIMLRNAKTPDDVYKIGAKYLGVKADELKSKYEHLNAGQQRMNVGNRMRAKWKKDNTQ